MQKLGQRADAKLKELRAEVLREKLLRDSGKQTTFVAQEAATKHKEKIGRLSAYLRLVAAPCAAKKELLEDANDDMPGAALDAAGAEVVASASAEAVGVASVSTKGGSESDEGSDGSASDDDGYSSSQEETTPVANTGTAQDAGEAPRASSPRWLTEAQRQELISACATFQSGGALSDADGKPYPQMCVAPMLS